MKFRAVQNLTLGLTLGLAAGSLFAQNIAVVNGRPIPASRVDQFLQELAKEGRQPTPELVTAVKNELLEREILVQEAERRGLSALPENKFKLDASRQQILIQALIQDEITRNPIGEADLRKAYEAAVSAQEPEFNARHILVGSEAEAQAILAQLKKGAKFETLAQKSRDPGSAKAGGSLGWSPAGRYVPSFAAALRGLKKGELSAPVQSQFGWHVIRLDDVRNPVAPPFEQVKGQLAEQAQRDRLTDLQLRLKTKAKIQ